ncbi:MAG TPA: OmpA family protein [Candidatus Competibacteraceae bacterium]|nr:MAG: OmpA family protein [Candidatus Competibacteraceae bacterium]HOB60678.1 OmpA family protein [Candidatus Competibacteraceae bacterium]HQA26241.1 OmpA family protein [Candidatus Competibacteraceae bacterium]HQD57000.1 OmpA family protein [Candidatus Competibacteraceae bacterium]
MKVKLHKLSLGLAASMVLFAAMPAHALNKYGCIYAVDPWDKIVKDPYGHCIRTPYWTPEKNVPECGGGIAEVPPPAVPQCEKVTLGTDTLFDFNKYNLKPAGVAKLNQLASDIRRTEKVTRVKIVGNTDGKGTEAYNYKLGLRRAETVASYLSEKGVPRSEMVVKSDGKLNPVAPNTLPNGKDNPEGRALNRRVDVTTITEACRE